MARRRRPGGGRQSRAPRWTLALLILASISVITLSYRGDLRGTINSAKNAAQQAFSPVDHAVASVLRPIADVITGAFNYGSLQTQNAKLRSQLEQLQNEQASIGDLHQRMKALAQLVHLPWADVSSIPTVTAQVDGLNSSNFADTVQLDEGTDAGIATGMPVVAGEGLVGRVTEAWSSGCTVELITDTDSAVSIVFGSQRTQAVVAGRGHGNPLAVDYVPPNTPLAVGEVLVTSGFQGDLFPPGIPVARATKVSETASATAETVQARPLQDLASLQYVDVLQWRPAEASTSVASAGTGSG